MTRVAQVIAQAKVNLYLRVLAREASGYHSIETLFQRLDWGDDVTVRLSSGRTLDCSGPSLPAEGLGPVEKNLAYRAAVAYIEATGWSTGFAIEIGKRIPVGGGMGGGSADAGAVLRALDALSPNPLGPRLVEIASDLGADVPFMAIESPLALGWSHGERLLPLRPLEPRPLVLLVPDFPVATADAYGWVSGDRGSYRSEATILTPGQLATWDGIAAIATNDFQRVVARRHPRIAELVDDLASFGASPAMMSGSGSTVFGVFADDPDAAAIARATSLTPILTRISERVSPVSIGEQ